MKQPRFITESTFRMEVRDYVATCEGLRSAARVLGVNPGNLSKFLAGRKHGGAKLGKAFGLRPVVAFISEEGTI